MVDYTFLLVILLAFMPFGIVVFMQRSDKKKPNFFEQFIVNLNQQLENFMHIVQMLIALILPASLLALVLRRSARQPALLPVGSTAAAHRISHRSQNPLLP